MEYKQNMTQAKKYAVAAFERIKEEHLAPTPDIFELWYIYYSGQNPEVVQAIDVLVSNKQKITNKRCKQLFQKLLSKDKDKEAVLYAGDQINTTIKSMTGIVRDVKSATTEYSDKLGGVSVEIEKASGAGELKKILKTVMSDTDNMITQNHRLEEQLDKSSLVMVELQRDLENVRKEAMTDGLTGLANRKSFDSEIERINQEVKENSSLFSLLMIDIDHFKNFNDNFGHQVGDQVLRLVAGTLTDGIKGRDVAARYGGEEFTIILPDTPLHASLIVAEALRKSVANKDVVNRNSGEKLGRITMSVGVAEHYDGEDIEDLIARADSALYTAKHNGRNQVASAPTPGKK